MGSTAPPKYERSYRSWISIHDVFNKANSLAAIPDPPSRTPLGKAPALALLNLTLALVYARSALTSPGSWTIALLFCAAANWCLLRASNVLHRAVLIAKCLKLFWWVILHRKAGEHFEEAFKKFIGGRKFCITDGGYMGWVPLAALRGDRVCFFQGCELPFVVRPDGTGWRLLGDCYLHGLMAGVPEGWSEREAEAITLV